MNKINYNFIYLSVLLCLIIKTANAVNCPRVDVDKNSRPIFLQFNDELLPYSYAFIVDDEKIPHKLLPKENAYESNQEHGKLYVIQSDAPINKLDDFTVSTNDSKGAEPTHNALPEPMSLMPDKFDGIGNATVCSVVW